MEILREREVLLVLFLGRLDVIMKNLYHNGCMKAQHPSWKNLPILKKMTKYLWWKTPEEALEKPEQIVSQVMNIGDYSDVCLLAHEIGDQGLREVLQQAEAGEFEERSWYYWHYRLGLGAKKKFHQCHLEPFCHCHDARLSTAFENSSQGTATTLGATSAIFMEEI